MTDLDTKALEAAARAICEIDSDETWDDEIDSSRAHFRWLARAAVSAYLAATGDGWLPIESAPKDGTRVLLLMKDPIPRESRPDLEGFAGVQFVGRCHTYEDGTNIGWGFAAPVGCGGLPDDWMVGWRPLPASPALTAQEKT